VSDQPVDEMRTATLLVPSEDPVRVWYRVIYATGDIDIVAVTNR
jgi:hypothetical protein